MQLLPYEICKTEVSKIQPAKKKAIWIPPWYDIIHLVPDSALPPEEQATRKRDRLIRLSQSPSPEIAKNIGIIMTSLDDLQDFMTTVGVFSRIGGNILKPLSVVARGSFTMGETLNQINLMQKSLQAIPGMVRKLTMELDLLRTIPKSERAAKRAEILRRHGIDPKTSTISLKAAKKKIEDAFKKHPKMGKIKTAVDKRMKRVLPTMGEALEIGQTTDMVASVGISLGAVVGLAQDLIFGIIKGVPIRFADQTISEPEYNAIYNLAEKMREQPPLLVKIFNDATKRLESFAYNVAAGKYIPIQDTIASTAASVNDYLDIRCSELKNAVKDSFDIIKGWIVGPKPHTKQSTLDLIKETGFDPQAPQTWPCPGLKKNNTIEEIQQAFQKQVYDVIQYVREQTNKTPDIEFFDHCLYEISKSTATLCSEDTEAIEITQTTELTIVTRAIDYGFQPPIDSTDEEFASWHNYITEQLQENYLEAPTYDLLRKAFHKFYG